MLKRRQNEVKRNIFLFDEVKKNIAGQVLKYNSKNWKKTSDVLYLTSRSIEQCQPAHKNHQRIEKLIESKLNKNKLIAKTLEAFKPKAKTFPFKNIYYKNMFKTDFCFWNQSSIISARPEKYSLALEDRLTRKWPKNLRKRNQLQIIRKCCWKSWYKYLQNCFCVSRGYPVTKFQALKNSLSHRSTANNFKKKFQTSKNRNSFY